MAPGSPQESCVANISEIANAINDGIDLESAILIARLAIEDLEVVLAAYKGRETGTCKDDEYIIEMQCESLREWIAYSQNMALADSMGSAISADMAYLDTLRVAEEAALQDRRAAEMVQRGEAMPDLTTAQRRVGEKGYIMYPELELELEG